MTRAVACLLVAATAFTLYWATLLPGQDLGDTASFQEQVGTATLTPRQGYPLYFAVGNLFVALTGEEPARALNLASAGCAALAVGAVVWVGTDLAGSLGGGLFAGLLLASSYTFWSQAIIAEVYALHLLMIAVSLASLLAWGRCPSMRRLMTFFGVYALSFGNHLSMILLAPAAVLFLLAAAPNGPPGVVNLRVLGAAVGFAGLGSLQYLWNFINLWHAVDPPSNLTEGLAAFWFDVTKSDWRESMILTVPASMLRDRLAMYWFDVRQQFGVVGVALAILGTSYLLRFRVRCAVLILVSYAVTTLFAYSYNVGDTHVFYLPSHLLVALLAGCGISLMLNLAVIRSRRRRALSTALIGTVLLYPAWLIVDTYPAVDRSDDRRATEMLDGLTEGLNGQQAILAADLNWQIQNGLAYYIAHRKPDLPYFRIAEALLHFPFLVRSNWDIGRDIVLTAGSARRLAAAYAPLYQAEPDPKISRPALIESVNSLPPGTPYALCLLRPYRDSPINPAEAQQLFSLFSGRHFVMPPQRHFNVMAGLLGSKPVLVMSGDRPFRIGVRLSTVELDIRMESWLPTDTIRRAGFGHIIANGSHALAIDRGISLVTLDAAGRVRSVDYVGGLYAPQPRYVLRRAP